MLRFLFSLPIAIAACGGNAQLRTEVEALRVDIEAMEARQDKAWQKQQEAVREPVRPRPSLASPPPAQPKAELGLVARILATTEKVCACQSIECAQKAILALGELDDRDKPKHEEMKVIVQSMSQMSDCMMDLAKKTTP